MMPTPISRDRKSTRLNSSHRCNSYAATPPLFPYTTLFRSNRDAGTRTYYRDAADRLRERVNADGSRVFYTYDALGRMTRIEAPAPGGNDRQLLRGIVYDADPNQPRSEEHTSELQSPM